MSKIKTLPAELSLQIVSQHDFPSIAPIIMSLIVSAVQIRKAKSIWIQMENSSFTFMDDGSPHPVLLLKNLWLSLSGVIGSLMIENSNYCMNNGWISKATHQEASNFTARFPNILIASEIFQGLPVRQVTRDKDVDCKELRSLLERFVLFHPFSDIKCFSSNSSFFLYERRLSSLESFETVFGKEKARQLREISLNGGVAFVSKDSNSLHHSKDLQFVFCKDSFYYEQEDELKEIIQQVFKEKTKNLYIQLTNAARNRAFYLMFIIIIDNQFNRLHHKSLAEHLLSFFEIKNLSRSEEYNFPIALQPKDSPKKRCKYSNKLFSNFTRFSGSRTNQKQLRLKDLSDLSFIGQLNEEFILVRQNSDGLLLIVDQHAADERIRYEQFQNDLYMLRQTKNFPSAKINEVVLHVTPNEQLNLKNFRDSIEQWGYSWEEQGNGISVKRVPIFLGTKIPAEGILEITSNPESCSDCPGPFQRLIASKACRGAIKFGTPLSDFQCKEILHKLSKCQLPFQCAHGRPSIIPLERQL